MCVQGLQLVQWVGMAASSDKSWSEKTWSERLLGKRSPLVPLGAIVTAGVLASGLYQFKKDNKRGAQKMMRYRVAMQVGCICEGCADVCAQFITIGVMMGSLAYSGVFSKKPPAVQVDKPIDE